MLVRLLALALFLPTAAQADTRREMVTGFDRVRIQGPYDVRLATGRGASARVDADRRLLGRVSVEVQGTTLVVSTGSFDRSEAVPAGAALPVVTLTTIGLRGATVNGGGRLTITGMKAQKVELAVSGSGSIAATGVDADDLTTTLLGAGSATLAGSARRARLAVSGSGAIDATGLTAIDLVALLDGPGDIKATARSTARATTLGTGGITVLGTPSCTVERSAGGPVICGR